MAQISLKRWVRVDELPQLLEDHPDQARLDERTRQAVTLEVGAVWQSPYELYAHSAEAAHAGLDAAVIADLRQGTVPSAGLSEREQIPYQFALRLTRDRRVDEALFLPAPRDKSLTSAGMSHGTEPK
jgi:4-carboxymuconolactone decarboxylase